MSPRRRGRNSACARVRVTFRRNKVGTTCGSGWLIVGTNARSARINRPLPQAVLTARAISAFLAPATDRLNNPVEIFLAIIVRDLFTWRYAARPSHDDDTRFTDLSSSSRLFAPHELCAPVIDYNAFMQITAAPAYSEEHVLA